MTNEPLDHQGAQKYKGSFIQSLVFVNNHDASPGTGDQLRITTNDEAGMFLWAAQWLDEHRQYFVTAIELKPTVDPNNTLDSTRTLVLRLNLANDRRPTELGPWTHGVPPLAPTTLQRPTPTAETAVNFEPDQQPLSNARTDQLYPLNRQVVLELSDKIKQLLPMLRPEELPLVAASDAEIALALITEINYVTATIPDNSGAAATSDELQDLSDKVEAGQTIVRDGNPVDRSWLRTLGYATIRLSISVVAGAVIGGPLIAWALNQPIFSKAVEGALSGAAGGLAAELGTLIGEQTQSGISKAREAPEPPDASKAPEAPRSTGASKAPPAPRRQTPIRGLPRPTEAQPCTSSESLPSPSVLGKRTNEVQEKQDVGNPAEPSPPSTHGQLDLPPDHSDQSSPSQDLPHTRPDDQSQW